jgi:hypothetical protein
MPAPPSPLPGEPEPRSGSAQVGARRLDAVHEENEESQAVGQRPKRKASEAALEDAEVDEIRDDPPDAEMEDAGPPPSGVRKRRAVEDVNAVGLASQAAPERERAATTPGETDAPSHPERALPDTDQEGALDSDERFLLAINSLKRGRKKEDDFDRDFNRLRISRPEPAESVQREEWDVLAEFGEDSIRGNFMVVVEMEVAARAAKCVRRPSGQDNVLWAGRDDFKRFKKVSVCYVGSCDLILNGRTARRF